MNCSVRGVNVVRTRLTVLRARTYDRSVLATKTRVRAVLKSQERSQAWLARQIAMNETLLAHYLAGRRAAPPDLVPRLARALGVTEATLRPEEPIAA